MLVSGVCHQNKSTSLTGSAHWFTLLPHLMILPLTSISRMWLSSKDSAAAAADAVDTLLNFAWTLAPNAGSWIQNIKSIVSVINNTQKHLQKALIGAKLHLSEDSYYNNKCIVHLLA